MLISLIVNYMSIYSVVVKPLEARDENNHPNANIIYPVDIAKAKEVMQRWDAHQNIQIGDSYISWQRIVEVTAPPSHLQIESPAWCGKCEKGWLFGPNGAYPCSCNTSGREEAKKYKSYLEKQDWYTDAKKRENSERNLASLYATSEEIFNS